MRKDRTGLKKVISTSDDTPEAVGNDALFQTIFEQSPLTTQIFSADGKLIAVNKAWEKLWGIRFTKDLNYNVLQDKQLVEQGIMTLIKRAFKGETIVFPPVRYEPNRTRKGVSSIDYRWTKALMYPVKNTKGKVARVILTHEDITDQMEYQTKIQFQANILQNVTDSVVVTDLNGIIIYWNQGATDLFGYTEKEMLGKTPAVLYPKQDPKQLQKDLALILKGKDYRDVWEGRTKKGKSLLVDIHTTLLKDNDGKAIGFIGVAKDITERNKAHEELSRQKDEFLGIASHELKTPVTSIKAYGQVLQRLFRKEGNTTAVSQLLKMDAQINRLTDLISDLLDVTKIQSGKLQMQEGAYDFNGLVNEVVDDLQLTTDKHTLIKTLDKTVKLYGDRERTGQVLTNLITNAIKYSPHSKKIIISTQKSSTDITLCVQDYGVGIPKDKQEKVFEQFFRVSGDKQHTFPGLGLGLYISSEIIKRQGGKIWVESREGKGSTFCFRLPIKRHGRKSKESDLDKEAIKHE